MIIIKYINTSCSNKKIIAVIGKINTGRTRVLEVLGYITDVGLRINIFRLNFWLSKSPTVRPQVAKLFTTNGLIPTKPLKKNW